ncbi:MAG: LPS assembly protein LptD [Rariglobus sp.]
MTRRLLPVLLLASASLLNGATSALPEITASRTEITEAGTVFNGDARLTYDGALLTADQISYDPRTQIARASGHVTLTRGSQRLLADELNYNLETRSYTVKDMRLGEDPIFVSGSGVDGDPTQVIVHNAVVTFSEPGLFTPTLRASKVTYTPGSTIRAEHARVGVGPILPVPVPLYDQSVNDPILSLLRTRAGYSSTLGGILELGLQVPVTPSVKLGGELGVYTSRGLMFGPAGSYKSSSADNTFRGSFKSGYINDRGDRDFDILLDPVPENRGYASWEHYQTINDNITLLGQLNYWSDSEITRDFVERDFRNVETPDNFLESYYTADNYVVSAFTRFQPNSYHIVQRRLPEIRFDGLPVDVGGGIYHRVNASIAALEDKSLAFDNSVNRFDAYYGLTRPFSPREWLSIKPVAGARVTYYDDAMGGRNDYSRTLGELGFDAEMQASSTYNYKNERWGIDGLRHVVKPYVSYRTITNADQGTAYIPPIDRTAFSTYLQPLGLGDRRDIDTLTHTNTMRLGVSNTLQTRDPAYGSRDLAELNVAGDWRLDRTAGESHFSAIQSELALMPANWLRFDVYTNITPSNFTLQEINTGVTFRDPGVWSVRVGTDFLKSDPTAAIPAGGITGIQEYSMNLRYFINEAYEALAELRYDTRRGNFSQQAFGLRQNIRNLWFIDYVLTFRNGDSRAGSTGFSVSIELASF